MREEPKFDLDLWSSPASKGDVVSVVLDLRRVNTLLLGILAAYLDGNLAEKSSELAAQQNQIHRDLVELTEKLSGFRG